MSLICLEGNHREYDPYPEFEKAIKTSFDQFQGEPLFTTRIIDLFDRFFLPNLPAENRQYYNCNSCRRFINKFGGLVTVDHAGNVFPVMWMHEVPKYFEKAVNAIIHQIMGGGIPGYAIDGIFLDTHKVLGEPVTGCWTHLHAIQDNPYKGSLIRNVSEDIAEKKADYQLLRRSLAEYTDNVVKQALLLLKSETMYRGEKVLGVAEWFMELKEKIKSANSSVTNALIWRAVALAPPGYCHVKNTMIGTLLDDLASGMSYERACQRFAEKMDPLKYQRPQVAPKAGNIERAEKIVEKLGIQKSLDRRYATINEIRTIWKPMHRTPRIVQEGVFSHIVPKEVMRHEGMPKTRVSGGRITWRYFKESIIPTALSIEVRVPTHGNFGAILTALYDDAPPIIQWDNLGQRNPFSWYVYHTGSYAKDWNLEVGWHKVTGITYQPSMWYDENLHQGKGVMFILDGCKDTRNAGKGNALFPEILKSELREVRSTIEAYSRKASLSGYASSSANGLIFSGNKTNSIDVRVTTELGTTSYIIDRWE